MGTSGSYTGGGGKPGKDLRNEIASWADSLPSGPPSDKTAPVTPTQDGSPPSASPSLQLGPKSLLPVIGLFASRSRGRSDGPGSGGGGSREGGAGSTNNRGGGAQRSAALSAATAGRAAGAAYAYRTGDSTALSELGLDYDELRASGDSITISQRIVQVACGASSDGTIEDDERREVAAKVTLWVLEENETGAPPGPDEISRYALAEILFEAMAVEGAALLHDGRRPAWVTREGQRQMRETAEVLAQQAKLSPQGASVAELARAIEDGLETLRTIWTES
jgi:hypothetical protein